MAGLPSFSVCKECHDLLVHSNHNIWKSSIMQDSDLNNIFNLSKKGYDYKNRYFEILGRGFTKIQLKESILNGWGFFLDHGHWVKVHKLPEYVYFNHSAHIRTGIGCTNCHGEIKEMEEAQTVQPLSMRWCIDCHRKPVIYQEGRKFFINESANPPITDCYGCHR
ncbi:MAG: cytochrome c3 family protein [Deltaproteobacteria bacterium]|nr:MAG: cytochrome c3 family protein [Deltaproteobacteria bacterium]